MFIVIFFFVSVFKMDSIKKFHQLSPSFFFHKWSSPLSIFFFNLLHNATIKNTSPSVVFFYLLFFFYYLRYLFLYEFTIFMFFFLKNSFLLCYKLFFFLCYSQLTKFSILCTIQCCKRQKIELFFSFHLSFFLSSKLNNTIYLQ